MDDVANSATATGASGDLATKPKFEDVSAKFPKSVFLSRLKLAYAQPAPTIL